MSRTLLLDTTRLGWLTLTTMMLVSRVLFQAAGAVRMRRFLDTWKRSRSKRIWGLVALAYAAFVLAAALANFEELSTLDVVVIVSLLAVLVADGSVNVLPAGFETFKDRMQAAWVRRFGGTERESDASLFGTVNLLLALAAAAAAAFVLAYRPVETWIPITAVALGLVFTGVLVTAAQREASTPQ
jgi:hypothetical protein